MNATIPIIFAVLATLFGGYLALRHHRHMHLFNAFTAGLLLGAVFFEVFPEAVELSGSFILVSAMLLSGFFAFYILQQFTIIHSCHDHCHNSKATQHIGLIGASGLILHRLIDGLLIGVGFVIDYRVGLAIAIAVIAHGFGDGITTVTVLKKHRNTKKRIYWLLGAGALAPILGAVIGATVPISERVIAILLAFFAGFFIYLATNDLLPEAHEERHEQQYITLVATLLGAAIMFGVALLA